MQQIFIAGYYGFGNLGDEAILAAFLNHLRKVRPDARVLVTHGGLTPSQADPVPWSDLNALVAAAQTSDLIIVGGGGLFFDYWDFDPSSVLGRRFGGISFYATFPLLAALLGKPLAIWAVGVGPFNTEAARRLTRLSFLSADYASVRDEKSAALLAELGLPIEQVHVTADPAFTLKPVSGTVAEAMLAAEGIPGNRPRLGVVLREWDVGVDPEEWATEVAAALDEFTRAEDVDLVFVPFQQAEGHLVNDARAAEIVIQRMTHRERAYILRGRYGPAETAGILGRCDLVLGMRLHSLILAAVAGVGSVSLIYDPKVKMTARRLGLDAYALELRGLSARVLAERLRAAWARREELGTQVARRALSLAEVATRDIHEVLRLGERASRPRPLHPEVGAWIRDLALERSLALARAEADLEATRAALHGTRTELARVRRELSTLETRLEWKRYRLADGIANGLWRLRHAGPLVHAWLLARLARLLRPRGPFSGGYSPEDNSQVVLYTSRPDLFPDYTPRAPLEPPPPEGRRVRVSLIAPARNEAQSLQTWWDGILAQTRLPDEIVVVESDSVDDTAERLRELAAKSPVPMTVVSVSGANIARNRNLAIARARHEVIACIDLGSRPDPDWLEKLVTPFEADPNVVVSAGWYEPISPDGRPVRGRRRWPDLRRVHPQSFLPAGISQAFRREAWEAVGGFPEWLTLTGEDTLFGLELKRHGGTWAFVPEAVVRWEAPESIRAYLLKVFRWAIGDGESGVHGDFYWRYVLALSAFIASAAITALGLALGLMWGGFFWLIAAIGLASLGIALPLAARQMGAGLDPVVWMGRAAQVAGFLVGSRRRKEVEKRRLAGVKGTWFILSGVPIDDTGGGARAAQLALEFLRQGYFVVFISKFPKYESRDLGLRFDHPNLQTYRIDDFRWDEWAEAYSPLLSSGRPLTALVEFPVAEYLPIVEQVKARGGRVVYDLIDDWTTSLGGDWYRPEVEKAFIDRANVLVATAAPLAARLQKMSGRPVHLLPNAVNTRLFVPNRAYRRPPDLCHAEWIMMYVGALWGEWFDWDLLIRLADAYPEAAVVVIGDYRGQCPEQRPNLHFLGLKPQRDLPAYLAYCDVTIIPWKVNKITQATSPLKVYEYLAMARPVVAPEIEPLRGIPGVWLARDLDEFVRLVAQARQEPYPRAEVERFVAANSWVERVQRLNTLAWRNQNTAR